jgi:IS5 family transposase
MGKKGFFLEIETGLDIMRLL